MSLGWTRSGAASAVIGLTTDPRPAWLWSRDGEVLIWHNRAAGLFGAKLKKSGLRPAEDPRPIRGHVARIARLGLIGRPTLSRMQFIAGRKPLSATCACTLIDLGPEGLALLIVGVDPIPSEIRDAESAGQMLGRSPFPEGIDYALVRADGTVIDATPQARALLESRALDPGAAPGWTPIAAEPGLEAGLFEAGPDGARLLVIAPSQAAPADAAPPPPPEPRRPESGGLTALVDRLAGDTVLFAPLGTEDEDTAEPEPPAGEEAEPDRAAQLDAEEAAFGADEPETGGRAGLWQVTGRGFAFSRAVPEAEAEDDPAPARDSEDWDKVERVSRYNFEELSRILTDRVGIDAVRAEETSEDAPTPDGPPPRAPAGALVTLSEETLVLNRLPLGILVFRDHDILFVNRALVDLTGYDTAATLRGLGLAAVFPSIDTTGPAGPVTHLVGRDGERIAVSARLQTVTWQGRAAFMLSAQAETAVEQREAGIRRFAALLARLKGGAYLEADRAGIVTALAGDGALLADDDGQPLIGQTLRRLVAPEARRDLEAFLDRPGPAPETERPFVTLSGLRPGVEITLFALVPGGAVGCFGLTGLAAAPVPEGHAPARGGLPVAALGRISRQLRSPLNTIVGFSELIATEAFGPVGSSRYAEYARDIRSAGHAIAALADELDDYVKLADGTLPLSPADIDLAALLNDCLLRVRPQASAGRVLLRSAVSERLPFVRADAATLSQAVLNLLASAIDQTGEGGKVVLSAQNAEDGSIEVHVRDSSRGPGALAEHFVLFRDGADKNGEPRHPVRSSIGLTLTRSLVAVNALSLSLGPASETGTLMTLVIPASLVVGR